MPPNSSTPNRNPSKTQNPPNSTHNSPTNSRPKLKNTTAPTNQTDPSRFFPPHSLLIFSNGRTPSFPLNEHDKFIFPSSSSSYPSSSSSSTISSFPFSPPPNIRNSNNNNNFNSPPFIDLPQLAKILSQFVPFLDQISPLLASLGIPISFIKLAKTFLFFISTNSNLLSSFPQHDLEQSN